MLTSFDFRHSESLLCVLGTPAVRLGTTFVLRIAGVRQLTDVTCGPCNATLQV